MAHDDYKPLVTPAGVTLRACPVCGAAPEIWQYSMSDDAPTSKAVMCSNGERIGPQDGVANDGCVLYMPPENFYRSRIVEAVKYWNEYAVALLQIRANRGVPNG